MKPDSCSDTPPYKRVGDKKKEDIRKRWTSFLEERRRPPLAALFASRADSVLKGQVAEQLRKKRESNAQAAKQSGVTSPHLDGEEALLVRCVFFFLPKRV